MSIHLGQGLLTAFVTTVVSLLVMESYQTTPWLADKLMRWSVRLRYADNPERATIRGEELLSLLEDLPTLFKLPTAVGFLLHALAYRLANHRSHGSLFELAVKRDAVLLTTLYLFNLFFFSSWLKLIHVETRPWLLLVWLYGMGMLVPLVWRDRAPMAVFAIEWVLTLAGWPIMPWYTPIVGVPVALYTISAHRSTKMSALALLASFIPVGLDVSVAFRINDDLAHQLYSFIPNAIFLALVTVGAWTAGRMTQANQQNPSRQTEPQAGQPSLKARHRVKRDVFLFLALYLINLFCFSSWLKLIHVETTPWLLLVWLYGMGMLVPLAWRDRAPMAVFAIEWVLTLAGWPIMPWYTPIVGVPVALYTISAHHSTKMSALALLASFIPVGLDVSVAFRVNDDLAHQLYSFIPNSVFLALVTVGAWTAGRMTQANQQNPSRQTEPQAG